MMLTHFGADSLQVEWSSSVICVGTFDGVHLGHRELLRTAARDACSAEIPSVAVTFDRHPAATLAPEKCPLAIASLEEDLEQIAAAGISACLILHFDKALSERTAQEFFDQILVGKLHATEAVVGHDFAFGHGREGTPQWLQERIPTTVVPPYMIDGERVSSRRIREFIGTGEVQQAKCLLGRPFRMDAVVVAGRKLGRELGFPTVNLQRSGRMVTPANGIYSGRAHTPLGSYDAAISIGVRPSVGGGARTVEAYLLDYPGESLYGRAVSLEFHARLRDELNFESKEQLVAQIAQDVEMVSKMRE